MPITAQEIRSNLRSSDAEFQRLLQEHSKYESQLEQVAKQSYLSSEDLLLETTLKKKKLHVKDQMEMVIARHERGMILS